MLGPAMAIECLTSSLPSSLTQSQSVCALLSSSTLQGPTTKPPKTRFTNAGRASLIFVGLCPRGASGSGIRRTIPHVPGARSPPSLGESGDPPSDAPAVPAVLDAPVPPPPVAPVEPPSEGAAPLAGELV